MKKSALVGVLAAALLAAGACSSTKTVSQDDVDKQVKEFVDNNIGTSDSVDCPELEAEKGKSITCTTKVDGEEYKIKVTVTEVTDDEAKFDIELADSSKTPAETTSASRTRTSESTRRTTSSRQTSESASVTTDSSDPGYVVATDVEEQINTQLTAQVGRSPDSVYCPDDLAAQVGATLTCQLTDGADTYDVYVSVTSVEGTDVLFDIQVANAPN